MAENSAIEWTDHTFNPWVGCTAISLACDHCYAETWAKRTGQGHLWQGERRRTSPSNWHQPVKWNAKAAAEGRRYHVFCASLADVFDNQVPAEWRADLFKLIEATPHLDWLLLTKRPQNIRKMLPADWDDGYDYSNVWLGTTVANQDEADRNIPHLLQIACRVRFLSIEPMLGPINLTSLSVSGPTKGGDWIDAMRGERGCNATGCIVDDELASINWVIAGGESGPKARPSHPDWFRSLRDQCAAAGVPFLFKQWGEFAPAPWKLEREVDEGDAAYIARSDAHAAVEAIGPAGNRATFNHKPWSCERASSPTRGWAGLRRVGKKAAGRLLDGVQHDGVPA